MAYIYKGKGRAGPVKRRKRIPSKYAAVKKALVKRSNMKIANVVKKVLAKKVETKCIQLDGTLNPVSLQSGTASIGSNNLTITPIASTFTNTNGCLIGEGVGQDQRIGDEITIKGMYFDYALFPLPYNATTNSEVKPMVVNLYFVRPKNGEIRGPFLNNYISSANAIFFENQTNAGSGFVGNLSDLTRKIDRDNYQLLAFRSHKIFYSNVSGTGVPANYYGYANNDFKFMAKGRVKISTPKTCKYDRLSEPKIQPVYMICQWVYADNTVAPTTRMPLQISLNNTIYYTDM